MTQELTEVPEPVKRDHLLSDRLYSVLNRLALIIFPSIGTLYFALSGIWGLPAAEQVVGTIVAVDTFLGVLVKVGETSYNASDAKYDGDMKVVPTLDGQTFSLELNGDPAELLNKKQVIFKVQERLPDPPAPPTPSQ